VYKQHVSWVYSDVAHKLWKANRTNSTFGFS